MSFKIDGLDKLQKQLKKMQRVAREMDGTHKYSYRELFPPAFMRKFTKYSSMDEFLENCGFPASTTEEFEAIPDAEFDEYVRRVTRFKSWEDMQGKAAEELIVRRMGL